MIPRTYAQWKQCITQACSIPLSAEFVAQRLAVWRDAQAQETQHFRRLYGDEHWQAVISWFEQAEREVTPLAQPSSQGVSSIIPPRAAP